MKKIIAYVFVVLFALFVVGCKEEEHVCQHTFSDATCTSAPTCSNCGLIQGECLGHNYELVSQTPSTCTTAGHVKLKCSRCKGVLEYDLDLAEHSYCEYDNYYECSLCHEQVEKKNEIKNLIIIIGDGMGFEHVAASQIYYNEQYEFTKFKNVSVNTDSIDSKGRANVTTDSAAGGTAIATGRLTINDYVATNTTGEEFPTILDYAKEQGMMTGVITTSTTTDATPSDFTAHSKSRDNTSEIIASQLHSGVDFIGGATQEACVNYIAKNETEYKAYTALYQLDYIDKSKKVYASIADMDTDNAMTNLTKKAIKYLTNDNGFVLMVEQELIDMGGHDGGTDGFLRICKYVKTIDILVDYLLASMDDKTLAQTAIIVTADHETGDLTVCTEYQQAKSVVTEDGRTIYFSFETTSHSDDNICLYYHNFDFDFSTLPYYHNEHIIKNCDTYLVMKAVINQIRGIKE